MNPVEFTRRQFLAASVAVLSSFRPSERLFGARPGEPLQVGIAQISITPSWTTSLWGYDNQIRYTSGVRDEIFAKAFLFQAGSPAPAADSGTQFLIIMMDLGAIGFPLTRRIARQIHESIHIREDAVMLQVTHDHSAPAVLDIPSTPADERFQRFLQDKLLLLAEQAHHNLAPAALWFGHAESSIALNRRVGDRKSTWDKDSGPIDANYNVLLVKSLDGQNRGAIVNYPSHPVTLREDNERISADFPGVLYSELGRSLKCPVAYMQGCCGDMIPKVFGTEVEMQQYGRKMADEALRALRNAAPLAGNSVECRSQRVLLTFLAPYTLEEFRSRYMEFAGRSHWIRMWAERYLRYLEDGGDIRESRDTIVQALRIGDLAVAILPGEILHLTAALIRQHFPGRNLMIAAYSNDTSVGYLPHADEYPLGRYEVEDAWKYYGTLRTTPEMEKSVREASLKLLHDLMG